MGKPLPVFFFGHRFVSAIGAEFVFCIQAFAFRAGGKTVGIGTFYQFVSEIHITARTRVKP